MTATVDKVDHQGSERRKGAVFAVLSAVIFAALAFFSTPILVGALGVEDFGRYSLALSVLAVFMLFDGGMSQALVRFAVRARTGRGDAVADYLGRAIPFYGIAVGILMTVAVTASQVLPPSVFGDGRMSLLFALALLGAAMALLANPFRAVMIACERFMATHVMETVTAVATALGAVMAAVHGWGAVGALSAVVAGLAGLASARAAYVVVVLKVRPRLSAMPRAERGEHLRLAGPVLVAVMIEAVHQCMSLRGVNKRDVSTITTQFTGLFKDDLAERD
ncbi:MAG: GTP cyclohydrolase I, partial [Pseudomonadota bacterium]